MRVDDRTFTCYRFGAGQKYPYFYPVNGPVSGVSVTTESSLPWPHHRSLFFGSDKVNGGNYWQEGNDEGQIVSRGPTIVVAGPDRVEIADECEWRKPGAAPILIDRREIRIEAPSPRLRTLRFRVTLVPQTEVQDRADQPLALRGPRRARAVGPGRRRPPQRRGRPRREGHVRRERPLVRRLGDALRPARGDRDLRQPEEPLVPVEVVHPRLRLLLPHALQLARRRGAAARRRARRSSSSTWSSSTPATRPRRGSRGSSRSGPRSGPRRPPAPRRRRSRPRRLRWNSLGTP